FRFVPRPPQRQPNSHGERRPGGVDFVRVHRNDLDALERLGELDWDAPVRRQVVAEPGQLGAPAGENDLSDALGFGRRREIVEGPLNLERQLARYRFEGRHDGLPADTDVTTELGGLRLLEWNLELLRDGLRVVVTAEGD